MENQDEAVRKSGALIDLPGNPLDKAKSGASAQGPATGIHSGGDRLLFGTPHPDGAAPVAADLPENGAAPANTRESAPPAGYPRRTSSFSRNPLGTVAFALAAGFLLGRLLP